MYCEHGRRGGDDAALRWKVAGPPVLAIGLVEHLGDVMAAEPVSCAARKAYPDAWIVWAVRSPYAAINHVLIVSCLS